MFKTTFLKTLYTKRLMIITWTIGIAALVVFTMIFYPSLSKSFAESLQEVPESLQAFIGSASAYRTIGGYTDVQIISQMVFMTIILGVILFSGLLAGEEGEGTLQTLLAQPVNRTKIYFEKLAAAVLLLGIACLGGIFGGVGIGVLIIGESINVGRLLIATLAVWLVTLIFSVLAYALGAITGKRGFSGGLAGALAFVSLLISSLAVSVKGLRFADKFSPFHYFNKPGIMQFGPRWGDILILTLITLVLAGAATFFFKKRDIYQK